MYNAKQNLNVMYYFKLNRVVIKNLGAILYNILYIST